MVAFALVLLVAAPGDVYIVDGAGSGDFLRIQDAVDAAADGDAILVRAGDYEAFAIAHKGLTVVADGGPVLVHGARIQNTLEEHAVVLAGLELRGENEPGVPDVPPLFVSLARGPVRIEDCALIGGDGLFGCDPFGCGDCRGGDAAVVEIGLDLAFARCTLRGGQGEEAFRGGPCNAGGHGIVVEGGSIAVHDCLVVAGDGWDSPMQNWLDEGGDGGDGLHGSGAATVPLTMFLQGSEIVGGEGGDGDICLCMAGAGGDGVHLVGAGSKGFLLDDVLGAGDGGCGGNNPPPGELLRLEAGARAKTFVGSARSLQGPRLLREHEVGSLELVGQPGDLVLLLAAARAGFRVDLPFRGVRLLRVGDLQRQTLLGTIGPSGQIVLPFQAAALPPGVEGATIFQQALVRDAASLGWWSGAWTLVVIDEAL